MILTGSYHGGVGVFVPVLEEGGDLGNSSADEYVDNIRNGSQRNLRADTKNDKKKERVLSRVFKRVIGE
eukprot:scaffold25556_cov144-Skeletonema_dohrnii-CCMP3373.AAC.4